MASYTLPSLPSLTTRSLKAPLPAAKSASAKPCGASLKVIVTLDVSPILSASSDTSIVAVGATVSTEKSTVAAPVLPAASVCETPSDLSAPCPMAARSSGLNEYVQAPVV